MKRTTRIFVLQLGHLFAKPIRRKLVHQHLWRALSLRILASHTHRHHIRPPAARRRCYPTFSEVIQDLEAQGGRDISRYLAMNELYNRANSLRPIFALSLDDTDKKEIRYSIYISFLRCPSKYSARDARKFIQAVKLYDQLLTEQRSRPS